MVKKKKHPNAPKAAMGPYMWFCQDQREKLKAEDSSLDAKGILSALGAAWRNLNANQKQRYEQLAAQDKQRFDQEKEVFLRTHESIYLEDEDNGGAAAKGKGGKGQKSKKKAKDPNAPKRARSAYILFVNDHRAGVVEQMKEEADGADLKPTEIMSRVALEWKGASEADKEKYNALAQEEKERFTVENARYKASLGAGAATGDDYGNLEEDDYDE